MHDHILEHIRDKGNIKGNYYVIRVEADDLFWMVVQVAKNYTLQDIDEFLRSVWLDCCGHASGFRIGDYFYDYSSEYDMDSDSKSIKSKLSSVLDQKNMSFSHSYDFGTETTLQLTVLESATSLISDIRTKVRLLAIHDPVKFICDKCGGAATSVCGFCSIWEPGSILCDSCMEKHSCYVDDDSCSMQLVQSPRTGMCGYEGPVAVPGFWYLTPET